MSASIDNDPAEEGEDARGVLASWLDDYISGRCDRSDMQASFLSVCRSNPDAPWDALALLDQYQRRGRIETALARSLKTDIAQLVFGIANQTEPPKAEPPQDAVPADAAPPTLDTTGSRWRKLMAERSPESVKAEPAFADPSLFRRDFDPATRPPAPIKAREAAEERGLPAVDVLRDRYELLSILGRGSSGTVYKALDRHRSHLSDAARCVAVKVLKLNYHERPEALAELEREFHQAQSLSHPNVVSVFDLDRDGNTFFIVMELLEGEQLSEVLRHLDGRPMLREHALAVIGGIGAALAYAHRRDVIHADLKPRNVMITRNGEIRVLDFGFARNRPLELHSASFRESAQPAPAYASVERVNGSEPHSSDDVYSLACIGYELLSGIHPFGGRSAVLARAHARSPQRIPGLSGRQSQVLQRALLWTRGERKIDVIELLAGLGCAELTNRLVPLDELTLPHAAPPPRRGWIVAAAAAVVLAALAAFWYLDSELVSRGPAPALVDAEVAEQRSSTSDTAQQDDPAGVASTTPVVPPEQLANTAAVPRSGKPPVAATGTASAATVDGAAPVAIDFDKDTYVATESDGSVRLTIRRHGPLARPVSFRWTLRGNSAEQGRDFAGIGPDVERIAAGASEVGVTIPLVSDAVTEGTEVFLVEIESAQDGVTVGERSHAAVIVVDDD